MTGKMVEGTSVKPQQHRDFLLDIPTYHYYPRCGHSVSYRVPLERGSYGYCYQCSGYFEFDYSVLEAKPRNWRQSLTDKEIVRLEDLAILKNRIADLLIQAGVGAMTESFAQDVAKVTGTSVHQVRLVHSIMGIDAEEEAAAA